MQFFLLLAAVTLFATQPVSANEGCPCAAHFSHTLSLPFVKELHKALHLPEPGARMPELLQNNGILLYLDETREARLKETFAGVLLAEKQVPPGERKLSAPTAGAVPVGLRVFLHPHAFAVEKEPSCARLLARARDAAQRLQAKRSQNATAGGVQFTVESLQNEETFLSVRFHGETGAPLPSQPLYEELADFFATQPGVMWVEPRAPVFAKNLWSAQTVQGAATPGGVGRSRTLAGQCKGTAECSPFWAKGYFGQGQIVGVSDTGAANTCMLRDPAGAPVPVCSSASLCPDTGHDTFRSYWRGVGGDTNDGDGHGTHVTGTVSGGTGQEEFSGIAPAARIAFVDVHRGGVGGFLSIPEPYDTRLFAHTLAMGAPIHSASWGAEDERYSADDMWVDAFSWKHREFLAVFAAGNNGERGSGTILSPGMAKNALTVGAVMNGQAAWDLAGQSDPGGGALTGQQWNTSWVAPFSSRGGARQRATWPKPDVCAPGGQYVWSSSSACRDDARATVEGMAGTSMATPLVSGAAALAREVYAKRGGIRASGSLLRATLIAASEPGSGVYPAVPFTNGQFSRPEYAPYGRAFVEGHGTVRLRQGMALGERQQTTTAACVLSNENAEAAMTRVGQGNTYCVSFARETQGQTLFTAALSWVDPPQSAAAGDGSASILNDLDVQVIAHGRRPGTRVPWQERHVNANGLDTRDSRSPNERIRVVLPGGAVGVSVRVVSQRLQFAPQTYSLLVTLQQGAQGDAMFVGPEKTVCTPETALIASEACVLCEGGVFDASQGCGTGSGQTTTTLAPAPTAPAPTATTAETAIPTTTAKKITTTFSQTTTSAPEATETATMETTRDAKTRPPPPPPPLVAPTPRPTNTPTTIGTPFPTFFIIDEFPDIAPPDTPPQSSRQPATSTFLSSSSPSTVTFSRVPTPAPTLGQQGNGDTKSAGFARFSRQRVVFAGLGASILWAT